MAKTAGVALTALAAGAAAGLWDQEAADLGWTLSLLGGAAFLLSAAVPRWAAGVVALLATGVLAAHLASAAPAVPGNAALYQGLTAAAVAATVAAIAALLGVAVGAASAHTANRWSRR